MDDLTKPNDPSPLNEASLSSLAATLPVPTYDRSALTPGIVHIGLGNFHRGHQAWYLHRLMEQGKAHDWAIVGAGVRSNDAAMRDRLLAQDCLTTLIELRPDGTSAEICGSMIDFLPVEEGNGALIAQMAERSIRIVSLTVTEGGYFQDAATGSFTPEHADIQHDVAYPDAPCTAFGAIVAALKLRRASGAGPFTVQSCDNLRGNGTITKAAVVGLAQLTDSDLANWIEEHVSFPNAMVDCIVPATGPQELALARVLGVADAAPVTHESFRQWVIEDDFCAGRPDWDLVGATFTNHVHDYEAMKIRILNAGHQVLANAGELLNVGTISDCMADPLISAFFARVQSEEIVPHVADVPEMTAPDYLTLITGRFSNGAIRDTVRRVAYDGSSRHSGFILPIVRDALEAGTPVSGLALCEALWCFMCLGTREDGSSIEANDPIWDLLQRTAAAAKDDPQAWLGLSQIYGDLGANERFANAFASWLSHLHDKGPSHTLAHYVQS
ncbi:mannitol dehydrogenase family protein [Pontivivens insulae]|uniref:Mannitol 2-dehydrogenase n=1 Tax=Pontivivens insulae TaxID=1639689 RepID=A0A2R8AFG1_9RHOB|nr:mannitol dehydrogenase family protein [Pontivivens insulae]RED12203.1 mannitol 2-dehydrogenase [Pontivivens insulae]SPF30959.1 Mannitol 2-dehydrogenase [Pontivivens insulae]